MIVVVVAVVSVAAAEVREYYCTVSLALVKNHIKLSCTQRYIHIAMTRHRLVANIGTVIYLILFNLRYEGK